MTKDKAKLQFLSAFWLKILACLFMLVDHMGLLLFPGVLWIRYVGRLAYPLFAYFIAEGCRYTKNKPKRFLSVFILGVICEIAYIIFDGYYGNILLTFSISILLIYLLQAVKKAVKKSYSSSILMQTLFVVSVIMTYHFCKYIGVDYGFFGVITPVLVTLFDSAEADKTEFASTKSRVLSLVMLAVGLLLLSFVNPILQFQYYSLFSLLILAFYNGNKGKFSFKYGFYVFYPLHLVVLWAIAFYIAS